MAKHTKRQTYDLRQVGFLGLPLLVVKGPAKSIPVTENGRKGLIIVSGSCLTHHLSGSPEVGPLASHTTLRYCFDKSSGTNHKVMFRQQRKECCRTRMERCDMLISHEELSEVGFPVQQYRMLAVNCCQSD